MVTMGLTLKRWLTAWLLLTLVMIGCSAESPPEHLIDEDTYINLLAEFQLLKSYQNTYGDSVRYETIRQAVLQKYDVSIEAFKQSHTYYQEHLDNQQKRINMALEKLQKEIMKPSVEHDTLKPSTP